MTEATQQVTELEFAKESTGTVMARVEHDAIITQAESRPRSYGEMLKDLKEQLAVFKQFAQEAMYAKPVGRDNRGKMKYHRGLSIRAAEAIAAAFKYNRCETMVSPLGHDHAKVEASFVDYQNGRIFRASTVVPKVFRRANGGTSRHDDVRFYGVVCKAEASKLLRECILRTVPPGLTGELQRCVNDQLDSFLDDKTIEKLVAEFANLGVTEKALTEWAGKRPESLDIEDRAVLVGLYNGIKTGEFKVDEIFALAGPEQEEPAGNESEQLAAKIAKQTKKKQPEAKAPAAGKDGAEPKEDPAEPVATDGRTK